MKDEKNNKPNQVIQIEILQEEEEDNETQTMDYQGEKGKESSTGQGKSHTKRKAQSELTEKEEKEGREKMDNVVMEFDTRRGEELSSEEEVLRKLLDEWRHLDERFIPEEQKIIYF